MYTPTNSPSTPDEKKEYENNENVKNAILCGLLDSEFVKVMHSKNAKEIWDKLHSIYEGDDPVKQAKLQTYRAQFEGLKMKKNELWNIFLEWMKLSMLLEDLVKRLRML